MADPEEGLTMKTVTDTIKFFDGKKSRQPYRLARKETVQVLTVYMKREKIPGPVPKTLWLCKTLFGQVLMNVHGANAVFFKGSEAIKYLLETPKNMRPRRGVCFSDSTYVM
jgi:hypothetical protein